MQLQDLAKMSEAQAFKNISKYVETHIRNNSLHTVNQDLAKLRPDTLSVMLNMCLIRALNKVKSHLSNWVRYYASLRQHLTRQGYDAPFLLRGL